MRRVRTTETIQHDDGTTREVPRADLWTLPGSSIGYVINRGGIATARYGNQWKSLRMPFTPSNRTRAVKAAEQWVRQMQKTGPVVKAPTLPTWSDAWLAFKSAKLAPDGSPKERRIYQLLDSSVQYFVDGQDTEITDDEAYRLTVAGLERLRAGTLVSESQRKYVTRWRRFLDYCRARGWLTSDPVALIRLPPKGAKRKGARTYSDRELLRMDRWVAGRGRNQRWYRLLGRFLLLTGCRIHEALALTWSEVHLEAPPHIDFRIAKGDQPRSFPLAPFPEVVRLLERIRREPAFENPRIRHAPNAVFPWRKPKSILLLQQACNAALAIDGGGRPIHVYRATAERRWRLRRLPPELRARLAGHSVEVLMSHYDAAWEAEELAGLVRSALDR